MEDELKPPRKKRSKKEPPGELPKSFQALAKLTNSDVIRQVKAGLSRIAPLETNGIGDDEDLTFLEEPPQQ